MIPIAVTATTVIRGAINNHQPDFDDAVYQNIRDELNV